jgi:hypothetical protein
MANILLDYFFKVTQITPTSAASTAFLKQVCLVVNPKSGQEGNVGTIYECTTNAAVAVRTDNTEAAQLFTAGMSKVFILLADNLNLATALEGHESDFFTVLISSDFEDADVTATQATGNITITSYANLVSGTDDTVTINGVVFTAQAGAATLGDATFQAATSNDATAASLCAQINAHASTSIEGKLTASVAGAVVTITADTAGTAGNAITLVYTDNDTNVGATRSGATLTGGDGLDLGEFGGVTGVSSDDDTFLGVQAAIANRCAFHIDAANGAKNMCYAFGKLLSNASAWKNQQFITMPFADDIETIGDAEILFDDRISFVISDDEFGERLAFFCAGGKAITAPYILKNIEIDLQSEALSYVSGNQPAYTKVQAALMEDELQKVIDGYIADQEIETGTVEVTLEEDNFVATGDIQVSEPRALWRIFAEMTQT